MCMISACVTKDYGVIAADSAMDDNGLLKYEAPKLIHFKEKFMTYIGYPTYFSKIDLNKFDGGIAAICIYMEEYFKSMKEEVGDLLKKLNSEENYQQPRLCVFLLGLHNEKPTLVQFNSFSDFKPEFLYSENGPKFSSIFYGDDDLTKKEIFSKTTDHMNELAEKRIKILSPGIIAEILTRGIYKKADMEEELEGKKLAGGAITIGQISSHGQAYYLSNVKF